MISWSPIYIPLILLSALMRLASTSAVVLYNNLGGWHHWPTHIGVKGSNRRPFILILDSILVYATSNVNEFVSISELMQSKKDKRTPRILETDFYSVYLTRQLWHFFYHLLYMARASSRIWIHLLFFQCPIFSLRNNIWDQTFCANELPLQLESRGEAHRIGFKPSLNLYIKIVLNL